MVVSGCGEQLRTPPWNENEIKQMDAEYSEGKITCVPLLRYEF